MTSHRHSAGCNCHRPFYTLLKVLLALMFVSALLVGYARAQDGAPAQAPDASAMPLPQSRPQGRIVRLRYVEGDVQVLGSDDTQFDRAVANMPLTQGSVVQTGTGGKAEVQFEDGSIARLVPGSQMALAELEGADIGSLVTTVELRAGTGYFEIDPTGNDVFTVTAGGLSLSIPDKGSFRVDLNGDSAQVAVADGSVRIQDGSGNASNVTANQTATGQNGSVSVVPGTVSEPFDQWNEDRDQQLNQEASATTDQQQGGDASGWSDMDYYGTWYPVPGVGSVWQPFGYGDDFDPFDSGYWAYYPWGYSWVSAYPWGWTPFHCGYWGWWNGFGWGWVPGGCGVGIWYPFPPVHHPPHGWKRPWAPRPGQPGGGRGRLIPVGKPPTGPHGMAPAHPSPHRVDAPSATIAGHTVQPVFAAPRATVTGRTSGLGGTQGLHMGTPPRPGGQPGSPWHGSAPMPQRNQQHFSAPPRSSPPPHSAPPPASHSDGGGKK